MEFERWRRVIRVLAMAERCANAKVSGDEAAHDDAPMDLIRAASDLRSGDFDDAARRLDPTKYALAVGAGVFGGERSAALPVFNRYRSNRGSDGCYTGQAEHGTSRSRDERPPAR